PVQLDCKPNGPSLALSGECFELLLADGDILKSSDFKLLESPKIEALKPEPNSPTLARRIGGKQCIARFASETLDLKAQLRVILRDDSSYIRQELTLAAGAKDVMLAEIVLFEQPLPGAETAGTVDGSPLVAGKFFLGYEHPMARNSIGSNGMARCSFVRHAGFRVGEAFSQNLGIGGGFADHLRRGFSR